MTEEVNLDTLDPYTVPSIDFIESGGVRFPSVSSPRCSVCQSEWRACIEVWYVKGVKAPEILRRLQEPEDISARSIQRHFSNEHVPSQKTIFLQHQIRKAAEAGVPFDEWEEGQAQEIVAVELVVDKFRQMMSEDYYVPSIRDGLAASKMLYEMKAGLADGVYDPNDMFLALATFINHTRTVMTKYMPVRAEEMMEDLGHLLDSDPILRRLIEKTKELETASLLDERDDEPIEAVDDLGVFDAVIVPEGSWSDERD